jgi:hypothetical protein
MSGTGGQSKLTGKGCDLVDSTPYRVSMSDHIDHRFDLGDFIDAAQWLDHEIGSDNWFYDEMVYYFKNHNDMIGFKLRYLYCD